MMGLSPRCYISSFVKIGPPVLEKKIFEGFYHIWARRPSWSCDPDAANKLSFPLPKEAPHKIWPLLAKRFWRRRSLSIVDGRTPNHEYSISSPMSHLAMKGKSNEYEIKCNYLSLKPTSRHFPVSSIQILYAPHEVILYLDN